MRDCDNVTLRERLPDLMNDRLPADARAEVEAHLATCADCRAELDLLRRVKASAVAGPSLDAARISARIPAYREPTVWSRAVGSWPLRAAAAILLLAGSATVLRNGDSGAPDSVLSASRSAELTVGTLSDISESDLQSLVEELKRLQAVTPTEPEVIVVPAVGRGGGGGGGGGGGE